MHCSASVRHDFERLGIAISSVTHDDGKREHVGRLIYAAFCVRFWTAPDPVPYLLAHDVATRRYICCIFKVGELDLLNQHSPIALLAPLDQDVVRLNICRESADAQDEFIHS